jgi:hypothetical protein
LTCNTASLRGSIFLQQVRARSHMPSLSGEGTGFAVQSFLKKNAGTPCGHLEVLHFALTTDV